MGNRLTQETVAETLPITYAYTYDDARGTKWSTPERSSRGYRLATVDGQTYTFDDNGNMLSDGEYTYTYDSANRLVGVSVGETTVSYAYNGDGIRLQQTANQETITYTTDLNRAYSQVLFDGTNSYVYGLDRIGMDSPDGYYTYQQDALGSVRQMMKVSGANVGLTLSKSYDPYGEVIYSNGIDTSFGYTGEQQDRSLDDLVYLRARHYSPTTGTFLSRDTWAGDVNLPMSYNKWLYTYANPVNYTDPSGKWTGDPVPLSQRAKYPERFDPSFQPPDITWEPSVEANPAKDLLVNTKEAQYLPRLNDLILSRGIWGYNLCGEISLEIILETATNDPNRLNYIWKEGFSSTKKPLGINKLISTAVQIFPRDQIWFGKTYVYNQIVFYDGLQNKNDYEQYGGDNWYGINGELVYPKLKSILEMKHYIIAGVTIQGSGMGKVVVNGGTGHWVVVTGLSKQWRNESEDSEFNWVRIINPFANRSEYYPWHYFKRSMHNQGYFVGELWNTSN